MKTVAVAVLAALISLGTATGCTIEVPAATPESVETTTTVRSEPRPEPSPEPKATAEVDEFYLDAELFQMLVDDIVRPLGRDECLMLAAVGPELFIEAFREGFTGEGQEWHVEYELVLRDLIEDECD